MAASQDSATQGPGAKHAGGSERKGKRARSAGADAGAGGGSAVSASVGARKSKKKGSSAPAAAPASCAQPESAAASLVGVTVEDADVLDCGVCFLPLKPPVFQIHHELRPILSGSSSSSTAACSSQLRMAPHQWEPAEELGLFNVARTLLDGKGYPTRVQLNREIADELNKLFPGTKVLFTCGMVKAKLSIFKERWVSQANIAPEDRMLYTTRESLPITGHQATFEALFTGESTNSGAVSLSESELGDNGPVNGGGRCSSFSSLKKEVSPAVQAALDFMAAGNGLNGEEQKRSTGRELLIFAAMLNDVPYLLATFNALPNNYEERRSALIDVFKFGGPGVPKIPQDKLPVDFL